MTRLTFGLPLIKDPVTNTEYLMYNNKLIDYVIAFGMLRHRFEKATGLSFNAEGGTFNINFWYKQNPEKLKDTLNTIVNGSSDRINIVNKMITIMKASQNGYDMFMQSVRDYYRTKFFYDYGGIDCIDADVTFCAVTFALAERMNIDTFIGEDIEYDIREIVFKRLTELIQCDFDDIYLTWLYGT